MFEAPLGYKYHYRFNGFHVGSDIEFPELIAQPAPNTAADISIRAGECPNQVTLSPYRLNIGGDEVSVNVPAVAKFLIRGNKEVIIDATPLANPEDIRAYFFSCIAGVLFHKSDLLPLHAAAVKWDNSATLITGAAITGKSTLALGLYRRGCEVLNDELALIALNSSGVLVTSCGPPYLKLPTDTLVTHGYDIANYKPVRKDIHKFFFPVESKYECGQLPIGRIIYLSDTNKHEATIEQINGLRKFELLRLSTYRARMIEKLGKSAQQFAFLAKLTEVELMHASRPQNMDAETFSGFVFDELNRL